MTIFNRRGNNNIKLAFLGSRERNIIAQCSSHLSLPLNVLFFIAFMITIIQIGFSIGLSIGHFIGVTYRDFELGGRPDGWESYSFHDIRDHFECSAIDRKRPLLRMEDWQLIRDKYKEHVDKTAKFDDPILPMDGYTFLRIGNKVEPPPYYAKDSPGMGRGVFASRDIKKGELTHDGTKSDVLFPDGMSWRRFIFSLPRERACDQTDWSWTQQLEEGGEYRLLSGINISIFHNGDSKNPNIGPTSSASQLFYAARDVKMGEELRYNYHVYHTRWSEVGL